MKLTRLLKPFLSKKRYQLFFFSLYKLALHGMNVGRGFGIKKSGEFEFIQLIAKNIGNTKVVLFDVGANIGKYTRTLYEVFDQKAIYYMFEPSKYTFETLKENLRDLPEIHKYNFGFGLEEGSLELHYDAENSGLASVYNRSLYNKEVDFDRSETISIKQLDKFCDKKNIRFIYLLKLDVEGHELEILKGASGLIQSKSIEYIQFEFGGANVDSKSFMVEFFKLLEPNYSIHRILKDGISDPLQYSEYLEIFLTTNYVAKVKR